MIVQIEVYPGLRLDVAGEYSKGEPDVNIGESFEVWETTLVTGTLFELLDWADSQNRGSILTKIEELCIEKVN